MIPESRQEQGLLPGRSGTENVSLASLGQFSRLGFVRGRAERGAVGRMLGQVDVRAPSQAAPVGTLSGGNQQKVLFARMLLCGPRVLVADEPTRGVDVGAKRAIYDLLTSLAADGLGVLLISSDVEEILGLAHRVLVMRRGKISRVLSAQASNGETVLTFTVLAGIVVGGTSILGGEGGIWRTVVGVLFIALIGNGFDLLGLNPLYEQITLGAVLLIAVGIDAWSRLRTA